MNTKQILNASKNLNWESMNSFIENSGLKIELVESRPFCKSWNVLDNKEIYRISNCIKDLNTNMSEVKFAFN